MFVDTEKDATIRGFLRFELRAAVGAVQSSYAAKLRGHRVSRRQMEDELVRAGTIYLLWSKVGGHDVDPETEQLYYVATGEVRRALQR